MNVEQTLPLSASQTMLITNETYTNYNANNPAIIGVLKPNANAPPTTYVTKSMLAPPISAVATISATSPPGTTSIFKTPLLPMPSLEDIEGGVLPGSQSVPGGILKYPTSSMSMKLSTVLGPGPSQVPASELIINDAMTSTNSKTNIKLQHPTIQLSSPKHVAGYLNSSNAALNNVASSNINCNPPTNINNKLHSTFNICGNKNTLHKPVSRCCSCFSRNNFHTNSSTAFKMKSKKRKLKSQTLWSALLTNLGICALLLAYTLLGSFLFLTIESENSMLLHQQRTLASTKRVGASGTGIRVSSSSSSNNDNINHTQQPKHHLDNGTIDSVTSTSSSSASSSSQSILKDINSQNANSDVIFSDEITPQLALSADTYDVRQRTIENIWDITVSLNILYKENWTKLAALEIAKFQDQLIKRLNEDTMLQLSHDMENSNNDNSPATEAVLLHTHQHLYVGSHDWNFARAFLYSLTVLTTIGYGNIAPKTTLGRLVTLAYAILGIPLTLVYLSSTGGILAKIAREVFSKVLCCCLCSNCGYCCYDEKRMAEKERRMKRKRQQEELRKQQTIIQEPYYVRSSTAHDSFQTPEKQQTNSTQQIPDNDSLSASESRGSMHGLSILAPILLCLSMMIIYITFGAMVLYHLENWPLLDGIYFCFMSLSTIGFGDMLPGLTRESTTTTWFCSIYIMSGMALTAMCFNVIHEEIVHRIKIVVEFKKGSVDIANEEYGFYMPS